MKNKVLPQNNSFIIKPFPFFVLRTPLFPYNKIDDTSYEAIRLISKEDCIFREAIFIASPVVYTEMNKWLNGELKDEKKIDKLLFTLLKYYLRMCSRATPFGLFSSISIGKYSKGISSYAIPSSLECCNRVTRLDMHYLCTLIENIEKNPEFRKSFYYSLNSSLYSVGDQFRYTEYTHKDFTRVFKIVGVDKSDGLMHIASLVGLGCSYQFIVKNLVDAGIEESYASLFVDKLIDNQFLVSNLEPKVTGTSLLNHIINILSSIADKNLTPMLKNIENELILLDETFTNDKSSTYDELKHLMQSINVSFNDKYLIQVDTHRPLNGYGISGVVYDSVLEGVNFFLKIINDSNNTSLNRFKEAFVKRYDKKEISLSEVLDPELGIGYLQDMGSGCLNPLVDNIPISQENNNHSIDWNKYENFIFKKLLSASIKKETIISLTDNDVIKNTPQYEMIEATFSVIIQIFKTEGNNNTPLIHIKMIGNPCAANLLGRFCHLSKELEDNVNNIIIAEESASEEFIFAEIIHLPESRTGNILFRPALRSYEIPYLASSSLPIENQIPLNDLFISVVNDKVILRSKKLNKRIIPRLSSAHIFTANSLPIYQFLGELQMQDNFGGASFSWGSMANYFDFLPRVVYKNIIFSPAVWKININEIKSIFSDENSIVLIEKVSNWRKEKRIPTKCYYRQFDNKLFIDFNNPFIIKMFYELVKKEKYIEIEEFLFDSDDAFVKNQKGNYTNEVILSFHKSMIK